MWKSLKDRAEGVKEMKRMKTTEAVGQVLCHDITQIIPGVTRSDILSGLNYNVVICSEEMDIEVPGKILYVTTDGVVTGKKTATSISEEREKAAESETETASESESTDGGSKSDGNAEKGQFEVESESKSAAGNEASDTADDAEEVKHTLTFVIYE